MHLATSPQAPAHQALPDPPQPACPCVARLCQVKSSATRNTVFRGKKKLLSTSLSFCTWEKLDPEGRPSTPDSRQEGD